MKTIVITSTGRCGTTFLVLLYTYLKFNTGFHEKSIKNYIYENCNSGLEFDEQYIGKLEVVKSPSYLHKMKSLNISAISFVIVPIRNFIEAAKSREFYGTSAGGMIGGAKNWEEQVVFFYKNMSTYIQDMVSFDIPTIFIDFDKMIRDPNYLFHLLKPTFQKKISFNFFLECYEKASKMQAVRTNYQQKSISSNCSI